MQDSALDNTIKIRNLRLNEKGMYIQTSDYKPRNLNIRIQRRDLQESALDNTIQIRSLRLNEKTKYAHTNFRL